MIADEISGSKSESEKAKEKEEDKLDKIIQDIIYNKPTIRIPGSTISDISRQIDIPRSTVTWHINRLQTSGQLVAHQVGRATVYSLSSDSVTETSSKKKEKR